MITHEQIIDMIEQYRIKNGLSTSEQALVHYFGGKRKFEKIIGHAALLKHYGSIEIMKIHLEAAGLHRSTIHRKMVAVQKAIKQKNIIDKYYNK